MFNIKYTNFSDFFVGSYIMGFMVIFDRDHWQKVCDIFETEKLDVLSHLI